MNKISKQTWVTGGLIIAALIIVGHAIDYFTKQHENIFAAIGLCVGLIILAYIVYSEKGKQNMSK